MAMKQKGKETFPDIVATVSLKDKNDIEKTVEELNMNDKSVDIVEFRSDTLSDTSLENINEVLARLKAKYTASPILFADRSRGHGGLGGFDHETYYKVMQDIICNQKADYVDGQLDTYEDNLMNCITRAKT